MTYDVNAVRACFPALDPQVARFDAAGGTLVPRRVATAVADTLASGIANGGGNTPAARHANEIVTAARQAVGDLLGCHPDGVIFGRSMTQLTYDMARTLAKTWRADDNIVLTRLDHDANIRPWIQAAAITGVTVRWVDFDPDTTELRIDDFTAALDERTRLVAVTAASNLLGTRPDLPAIAAAVHAAGPDDGALLYADGVHLTPHAPVDLAALGVDLFACSPYKFCGPHLGILAAATPNVLHTLDPDKLLPAPDTTPERFERGTLSYELLAGTTAAIDFLAGLADDHHDRRQRLQNAMHAIAHHEHHLLIRLERGLQDIAGITVHSRAAQRTPTVLFSPPGSTADVSRALARAGVYAPAGHFYAIEAARRMALPPDGAIRATVAPYNTADDIDSLLRHLDRVSRSRP